MEQREWMMEQKLYTAKITDKDQQESISTF